MTRRNTVVTAVVIAAAGIAIFALIDGGEGSRQRVAHPPLARAVRLAVSPSDAVHGTVAGQRARSPGGAVAAAVSYLEAMDRASSVSGVVARLREVTAPPFTEQALRAEAVVLTIDQAVQADGAGLIRSWRLGWRIDSFSPRLARVGVWTMGVAVSAREVIAPDWSTTVCVTRWSPEGWRVIGAHTVDGPTPPPADASRAAVASFVGLASGFRTFTDAP
jgi:hypothetical protein